MIRTRFARHWLLASAGAALLCGAVQASTVFPPRKAGLWQSSMVMKMTMKMNGQTMADNDATPTISVLCSDAATDALSQKELTGGKMCSGFDIEKSDGIYTINGKCQDPVGGAGATITVTGTLTAQGDEAFHMQSQGVGPNMSSSTVVDAKWLGACPAGMVPGDFGVMRNGAFVKHGNLLQSAATPPAGQ